MAYPGERARDRYRRYQINETGPQLGYEAWKAKEYKKKMKREADKASQAKKKAAPRDQDKPMPKPEKEEKGANLRRYESGRYG